MTSWFMRSRSFLYLVCSSLTFGASSDIARCVLICLTKIGKSKMRTSTVRKNSDKPQLTPLVLPNNGVSTEWIARITLVTTTYSGFRTCGTGWLLA